MKPAPFEYKRPATVEEAAQILAEAGDEASLLAGGQSLIPLLNLRLARPQVVVDINRVAGLDAVERHPDGLRVGALATAARLERDQDVGDALPVLTQALRLIAHPQIRARTTIGGNLAHADPSSELPALLLALEGSVVLASRGGERELPAGEFFRDVFTTAREPTELVTEVRLPRRADRRWQFGEVARRHGDYAIAAACVGVAVEDGVIANATVTLAGCGPTPLQVVDAEKAMCGLGAGDDLTAIADAVRDAVDPPADVHATAAYRRSLAGTLVKRLTGRLVEAA